MPETTPRRNPNARLSRRERNRLSWPHSCIKVNTRKEAKLISNTAATVSQCETAALDTAAHHRIASNPKAVSTWVNALRLLDLACRRMISRFCSLIRQIDDTTRHLGFPLSAAILYLVRALSTPTCYC